MARLTHPENGTVIHVDDDAAGKYQAAGWVADGDAQREADEVDEADEAEPATGDEDSPEPVAPHGNASADKWAEYAQALGVDVQDGADRTAIKAAIAAANE